MKAIGNPMQKIIISMPMMRPESGTGLFGTADNGITTKFMKR
jgi:hypothetical protein